MCLLMKTIILPKELNLSFIEHLDPAASLQEYKRTEEHIEQYHEDVFSKIQIVDSGHIKDSGFFIDVS